MAKTLVPDADAVHLDEVSAAGETITLVVTAVGGRGVLPGVRPGLLARA